MGIRFLRSTVTALAVLAAAALPLASVWSVAVAPAKAAGAAAEHTAAPHCPGCLHDAASGQACAMPLMCADLAAAGASVLSAFPPPPPARHPFADARAKRQRAGPDPYPPRSLRSA